MLFKSEEDSGFYLSVGLGFGVVLGLAVGIEFMQFHYTHNFSHLFQFIFDLIGFLISLIFFIFYRNKILKEYSHYVILVVLGALTYLIRKS